MNDIPEPGEEETLSETENYEAWVSFEEDGEPIYHLDTGRVTLHFFQEEWDEFLDLIDQIEDEE
jgi:hypothetical protein